MSHIPINPAILYWGTPVVLITSLNPNGTTNIAPMSSVWWLGHRCMLGLAAESQTPQNIKRTGQCVLNLASSSMGHYIDALAKTTGTKDVPEGKIGRDYVYVEDKWARSGLTPQPSEVVAPQRITQCPVQMECELAKINNMMSDLAPSPVAEAIWAIEVKVLRTFVAPELKLKGFENRIDTDMWKPMIMMFSEMYGLEDGKKVKSALAEINEERYRGLTTAEKHAREDPEGEVEEVAPGVVVAVD